MKNEKTAAGKPANRSPKKNDQSGNRKTTPVNFDATTASSRVRAHAGRGLSNEGTNVSYEDESRND